MNEHVERDYLQQIVALAILIKLYSKQLFFMPSKTTAVPFRTRFGWWASVATGFALSFWTSAFLGFVVFTTVWFYAGGTVSQYGSPELGRTPELVLWPLYAFLSSVIVTWPLLLRTRRLDVYAWNSLVAFLPFLTFWFEPIKRYVGSETLMMTGGFAGYWFAALFLHVLCGYLEHYWRKFSSAWKRYVAGVVVGIVLSVLIIVGEGLVWAVFIVTSSLTVARLLPVGISAALILVYWWRRWRAYRSTSR
jgi:hypothetical protein